MTKVLDFGTIPEDVPAGLSVEGFIELDSYSEQSRYLRNAYLADRPVRVTSKALGYRGLARITNVAVVAGRGYMCDRFEFKAVEV